MCCLFGLLDYQHGLSLESRSHILRILSNTCEERGTDATGIAYLTRGRLYIQKAPRAAHRMRFHLTPDARYIMGHARMTTQGDGKKNYNNHPFPGKAGGTAFALAHNGVLYNDRSLRATHGLPGTRIETDSYVAVQLIERAGECSFGGLTYMAEALRGSFTITVLDAGNNLYFVKGNNPLCIYHFAHDGFYLYASTKEILDKAVERLCLDHMPHKEINVLSGEILRIAPDGSRTKEFFNDGALWETPIYSLWGLSSPGKHTKAKYSDTLEMYAQISGYDCETLACLRAAGYSWLEIEQMLYDPAFMEECISELVCG